MKHLWMMGGAVVVALFLVTGCRVVEDAKAGLQAPVEAGQLSPMAQGQKQTAPLNAIPIYGGPLAWIGGTLLGLFYANRKGAQIRQQTQTPSEKPFTGAAGIKTGIGPVNIEGLFQGIANVVHFTFERGPENSGVRRTWQTLLSGLLALLVTQTPALASMIDTVGGTLGSDTVVQGAALIGATSLLMGIKKFLSVIKPVTPAT